MMGRPKGSNRYHVNGDIVAVDVSTRNHPEAIMLINKDDWDRLQQIPDIGRIIAWRPKTSKTTYAGTALNGNLKLVHRLLLPSSLQVDHQDGNGLNNLRSNIRAVTGRWNQQNRHASATSKYPGVHWDRYSERWQAKIRVNGIQRHLGSFKDEQKAAGAYRMAVHQLGEMMLDEVDA